MTMFTQRETRILDQARDIISRYYQRGVQLCSPDDVRRCVMVELAPLEHEEFGIILLRSCWKYWMCGYLITLSWQELKRCRWLSEDWCDAESYLV